MGRGEKRKEVKKKRKKEKANGRLRSEGLEVASCIFRDPEGQMEVRGKAKRDGSGITLWSHLNLFGVCVREQQNTTTTTKN